MRRIAGDRRIGIGMKAVWPRWTDQQVVGPEPPQVMSQKSNSIPAITSFQPVDTDASNRPLTAWGEVDYLL
jgi:hypothetical protein